MAIFRVQVFKSLDSSDREWSNTYLCEADTIDTVAAVLPDVGDAEGQMHLDNVTVTRARVSDIEPDPDLFQIVTLGVVGSRGTAGDGDWLPLFNAVRVDIDVAGGGRPSRKYYRSPLLGGDRARGVLEDTVITFFNTAVAQIITVFETGSAPLVDPDGQALVTPHTFSKVAMRQLHRKRRKATPTP